MEFLDGTVKGSLHERSAGRPIFLRAQALYSLAIKKMDEAVFSNKRSRTSVKSYCIRPIHQETLAINQFNLESLEGLSFDQGPEGFFKIVCCHNENILS